MVFFIILFALFAFVLFIIHQKNKLKIAISMVERAQSSVGVALKKRHELIPNLVECVKAEMMHESEIISALETFSGNFSAHKTFSIEEENEVMDLLQKTMNRLRETQQTLYLQKVWFEVEEQLSASRRFYDTAVSKYNLLLEKTPTSIFARQMKLKKKKTTQITLRDTFVPQAKRKF